jgi:O-antigen/teichoic acid export membrane protein
MSRVRLFVRGVSSSWLATGATVVYSLLSVPISLRYLSVDEFGLFVLLIQVVAYLNLVELGMSAATARILLDHKDDPNSQQYGSVILTGLCVFSAQAVILLILGVVAAPEIVRIIGVPQLFSDIAIYLLRWLAVCSAVIMAFRIYGAILYANKRIDVIHGLLGGNMLFGLVVLNVVLATGQGLHGLAWMFLAQTFVAVVVPIGACYKLKLLPRRGRWGKPSAKNFRELFVFGKDVFLVNISSQVLEASQLIIVTRTMGLSAAAVWSVSTKLFALVYQLVTKIEGTAIVFFAEMMVRGEKDKLAARFRQIYELTAGTCVVSLVVAFAINGHFVAAWANPSLAWSVALSGFMAAFVFLNTLTRCSSDLIIHSKNIAAFRYVYFAEAAVFVGLSLWLSATFGFYGVLGASIACLLLFRATYTTWRMAKYFELPAINFWWTWLKRPIIAAVIILPFVISSSWMADSVSNSWGQLFIAAAWVGFPAAIALLFVALPRDVRQEFALRWPHLSFFGGR